MKEKEAALKEIENSVALLENNEHLFSDSVYQELKFQLQRSILNLKLYVLISEAKLRYQLFKQSPDAAIKAGQQIGLQGILEQANNLVPELNKGFAENGRTKS